MKLEETCTKKVILKNARTFRDYEVTNGLYNCALCPGTPGSCPEYRNHQEMLNKFSIERLRVNYDR